MGIRSTASSFLLAAAAALVPLSSAHAEAHSFDAQGHDLGKQSDIMAGHPEQKTPEHIAAFEASHKLPAKDFATHLGFEAKPMPEAKDRRILLSLSTRPDNVLTFGLFMKQLGLPVVVPELTSQGLSGIAEL